MSLRKFTIQCGGGGRVNGAHNCHQEKDKKKKRVRDSEKGKINPDERRLMDETELKQDLERQTEPINRH